jgi:hypothetical protein
VLAPEANLGPTHISLAKGCYVGQEIVARIDSRGHTNRALTGFVVLSDSLPAPGDRLTPLALTTAELPQALQRWAHDPPRLLSNALYVQGQANAAQLSQQLDQSGRLGTVFDIWNNGQGQQVTLATHTEAAFQDVLALYTSTDAGMSGCPFVFQSVQPTLSTPNGNETTTVPLDVPATGHEFAAYISDFRYNALIGTATPATVRLQQVFYTACWRRGDVVVTVQLNAINQQPSKDEFMQLIATQDKKMTDAGLK